MTWLPPKKKFPEIIKMAFKIISINYKPSNQYACCQAFKKNELLSSSYKELVGSERERKTKRYTSTKKTP